MYVLEAKYILIAIPILLSTIVYSDNSLDVVYLGPLLFLHAYKLLCVPALQ